ncbi:MAG: phosphatase PAP2 family protein [Candidatus Omnitrophica bacterium]|nr:phosphatase PAP2 family protein [Candidatus Omnitrophota bacterium]
MNFFLSLDKRLFCHLNGWAPPFFDYLNFFITFFGEGIVALIIFIGWYILRRRRVALLGIGSLAVSGIISRILKIVFARPRPLAILTSVHTFGYLFRYSSFPSGHATTIFAAVTILSFSYKRFAPLFYSFAIAVAYSRIYLGLHWPSDLIAGGAIGYSVSKLFLKMQPRIFPTQKIGTHPNFSAQNR